MTRPPKYARKVDSSQGEIVDALRKVGAAVWIIGQPVDLLTYYRGRWLPMEAKPPTHKRGRVDQAAQGAILADFAIPKVRTAVEALRALEVVV